MSRREAVRRARTVAFFSLVLLACVAAPVLARSAGGDSGGGKIGISEARAVTASPSAGEAEPSKEEGEAVVSPPAPVGGGEEGPQVEVGPVAEAPLELQREPALETPQAIAERQESQLAYTELAPAESETLLKESFAPQLQAISADPSRLLEDAKLERVDSPTEALATVEGEPTLIDSSVPLRATDPEGKLSKVDLGLGETGQGYAPANPLVDVQLPQSAAGEIGVGSEGFSLRLQGASPKAEASPTAGGGLFAPEAGEDTSLLLAPISAGLELSAMLSSRNSPEQLVFEATLPAGAQLRAAADGGAEVVDQKEEVLYRITPPRVLDAQGTAVPATMAVKGSEIALQIPHRELDVAYPLFVDPEITEDWTNFADTSKLNYWNWQYSGVGAEDYIGWRSPIVDNWGSGLYVRSRPNFTYPAGSYGRWWLGAPNSTAYFDYVSLGPIHYDAHGCTANEPHGYVGVWNDNGSWSAITSAYPSGWITSFAGALPGGSRTIFVGIGAAAATNIKCGRDYALNGATLYLTDPENPTVSAPSGIPSGWIKQETALPITVPVSDPGLGVKSAKITSEAAPSPQELGCTGHFGSTCPASYNFNFSLSAASFLEGERSVSFSAKDILNKDSNTQEATLKIDRTRPGLVLKGQLAEATEEEGGEKAEEEDKTAFDPLHLAVYDLTIEATDGSTESAATKRSGVKTIEVFLDGSKTPLKTWSNASCPASSCPLTATYPLKLNELGADIHHTLRVLASDFAGNDPREREIGFEYVPATGEKDEYVMQHFPLFDTEAEPEEGVEATGPELAVNLMNGNLVFHQKDLEVPGPAADLEVERFYNSLLPEDQNTEWGDGWTLAQTPELELEEPESGAPTEGTLVEESGGVESQVTLPTKAGEEEFDPALAATITKEAGGGYALSDETGESAGILQFDESGQASELQTGEYSGVQYDYVGGKLTEIAVDDPATANVKPEEIAEPDSPPAPAISYASSLGSTGTGNGQLTSPADVATDAKGNLWVADRANNRVQEFSPSGEYLSQFGSAGTGTGQLNSPAALAIDAAGNIWVAEQGNHRVQEFSPSGSFIAKFGSFGFSEGKLAGPNGITIGADGSVWVSDATKVQKFTAAGAFVKRVGSAGSGIGQITSPQSLATAPGGNVYVADAGNHRIDVFDAEGNFLRQFGSAGAGNGQFQYPAEVDVDPDANVWVADSESNRVQLFDPTGDYLAQFGAAGSGAGQFSLAATSGIASDGQGRIWVADSGNDRVQRWLSSSFTEFLHSTDLGSTGTGNGQLTSPADVATDAKGNLWVLDRGNNRVQEFSSGGEYLRQFGSGGSGNGQFNSPAALAIDAAGNVWVADQTNNRVQKFSPSGEYLSQFGSFGTGNGKFIGPTGIAIGADGSIWVSDASKVQKFTAAGAFVKRVGSAGSGAGQITSPQSLATAPGGDVYVADAGNHRIDVFNVEGEYLRQFGSAGSGQGQFEYAAEVDVDPAGDVWVADSSTNRVQLFNPAGDYLAQFGSPGSGPGQFSLTAASGIASDGQGRIWVADPGNDRVQEIIGGNYHPPAATPLTGDDPAVEVETEGGLVNSVVGKEAGTIEYGHEGELLSAATSAEGETSYDYDGVGQMTKVTLPTGTYAEIAYEATYARVKSVKVSIEGGKAKTTYFEYTDSPSRSTRVVPEGPATVYDMAADGSFVRWQNVGKAPEIEDLGGNLVDPEHRETEKAMEPGAYELNVKAFSAEGIAKIEIIANGNLQVDEKTCTEDIEKEGVECERVSDPWITESANWAPGILNLEVVVTDREGHEASERFWVNIPYTPPPGPEAEAPPTYTEIKAFREEFGLDLDLKGDEEAINDRIFGLIRAWENPYTPTGEVARATSERWGVPLRQVDAAELDWREWYANHDLPLIHEWGEAKYPESFAGAYLDNAGGGLIRVGFTQEQATHLLDLQKELQLWAPAARMAGFATPPPISLAQLNTDLTAIDAATEPGGSLAPQVTDYELDEQANTIKLGAHSVSVAEGLLHTLLGSAPPVTAHQQDAAVEYLAGRNRAHGRILAGDELISPENGCTANFGVYENRTERSTGEPVRARFVLTAGHCAHLGDVIERSAFPNFENEETWTKVGTVNRTAFEVHHWSTDALAIRANGGLAPNEIYLKGSRPYPIGAPAPAYRNQVLCFSGVTTDRTKCKEVIGRRTYRENGFKERMYALPFNAQHGDSGSPVWNRDTGAAVGIVSARDPQHPGITYVAPLLRIPRESLTVSPGALRALSLDEAEPHLHLIIQS